MVISVSTSTFYQIDFEKALYLIQEAGYENIELATYSFCDKWETAQHLKGYSASDIVKCLKKSNLRIATLHETSGLISDEASYINIEFFELCNSGVISPQSIVLHLPYLRIAELRNKEKYLDIFYKQLLRLPLGKDICFENANQLDGYFIPYLDISDLYKFCREKGYYINLDTSHCARNKENIVDILDRFGDCLKTVHLSDYKNDKKFIFVGEGELPLKQFIGRLKNTKAEVITLECGINNELSDRKIIDRLKAAKAYVYEALKGSAI